MLAVLGLEALGWALAKLTVAWTKTTDGGVGECSKVIREPWLPLRKAAPFQAGEIEICGKLVECDRADNNTREST
ncbi:hypothetical protein VI817_002495 [Penicillium citrinum]|nr:hypothetical protein VI817_002495 [Penicillium citrinum]